MTPEQQVDVVLKGHKVTRTLSIYVPDADNESLVRDICSMAVAGHAVAVVQNLLETYGIKDVVVTTG